MAGTLMAARPPKPAASNNGSANGATRIEDVADKLMGDVMRDVEDVTDFNGPIARQQARVERLRDDLAAAELLLERMLAPLRRVQEVATGAAFKRLEGMREYDEALVFALGKYQINKSSGGGKAKPTDAQIVKNLQTIPGYALVDQRLNVSGQQVGYYRRGLSWGEWEPLIQGKAELILEVRRVMEIGTPQAAGGKSPPKSVKKKTAKKAAPKKKAVKKKKVAAQPAAEPPAAAAGDSV